jgi:hypothetical protein
MGKLGGIMALYLDPTENDIAPDRQLGHDLPAWGTGYGSLPHGMSKADCKKKAEDEGGYAWDSDAEACWMIFGKVIKIEDIQHSVMEGFEICNFNFHVNGTKPPVPTQLDLPGGAATAVQNPSEGGLGTTGFHSDPPATGNSGQETAIV